MEATRQNTDRQIQLAGIRIDAISQADHDYAGNAAIQLAKLLHELVNVRAGTNKFNYAFGELCRLNKRMELKLKDLLGNVP